MQKSSLIIGDLDPYKLYQSLSGKEVDCQMIIEDEQRLQNIYQHNLNEGSAVLRALTKKAGPSWFDSKIPAINLETYYNLAINKAKTVIRGREVMIAGVIGPGLNWDWGNEQKILSEVSENVILMDDFGVNFFLFEGFTDINQLSLVLSCCARQSNLPLASFLKVEDGLSQQEYKRYTSLADKFELELCGLECNNFDEDLITNWQSKSPFGLIVNDCQQILDAPTKILACRKMSMLLAGNNAERLAWRQLIKHIRTDEPN